MSHFIDVLHYGDILEFSGPFGQLEMMQEYSKLSINVKFSLVNDKVNYDLILKSKQLDDGIPRVWDKLRMCCIVLYCIENVSDIHLHHQPPSKS